MVEYIIEETKDGTITYRRVIGELIRCRECKYYRESEYKYKEYSSTLTDCIRCAKQFTFATDPDNYCSWAVKDEKAE